MARRWPGRGHASRKLLNSSQRPLPLQRQREGLTVRRRLLPTPEADAHVPPPAPLTDPENAPPGDPHASWSLRGSSTGSRGRLPCGETKLSFVCSSSYPKVVWAVRRQPPSCAQPTSPFSCESDTGTGCDVQSPPASSVLIASSTDNPDVPFSALIDALREYWDLPPQDAPFHGTRPGDRERYRDRS